MSIQGKIHLFYKMLLTTIAILVIIPTHKMSIVHAAPDGTRPIITSFMLKNSSGFQVSKTDDMVKVPIDSKIVVELTDDQDLTNLLNTEGTDTDNGLIIVKNSSGTAISGKTKIEDGSSSKIKILTFTPTTITWSTGETYKVSMNTTLKDAIDNIVFPLTFNFSTDKTWIAPNSENLNPNLLTGNPHGGFAGKENICFNCHGTQKNLTLTGDNTVEKAATAFCLSCHDGSSARDILGKNAAFQHGTMPDGQTLMGTSQCSDCHDTHLDWSLTNPNALKTKIVYSHPSKPLAGTQDTSIKSCYSCHKETTGKMKVKATTVGDPAYEANIEKPYTYKKMATTSGLKSDMELCFSCHNGSNAKATDISQYYKTDPTLDTTSGHKIIFGDRGNGTMQGYLTCSDCHETHGSDNIYALKTELGHEEIDGIYDYDLTEQTKTWTIKKEKEFCLKCHGGTKQTALYGVVAKKYNDTVGTHKDFPLLACSESGCHGSGTEEFERFNKAAHAPVKQVVVP